MINLENNEDNYKWFKDNLSELVKEYDGQYLVIKNKAVLNTYNSFDNAWNNTILSEVPGSFIIQLCSLDKEKTSQTFFSNRVSFK